jgi:hypothetical protein
MRRIKSYLVINGIATNFERARAANMITGNIQDSACKYVNSRKERIRVLLLNRYRNMDELKRVWFKVS